MRNTNIASVGGGLATDCTPTAKSTILFLKKTFKIYIKKSSLFLEQEKNENLLELFFFSTLFFSKRSHKVRNTNIASVGRGFAIDCTPTVKSTSLFLKKLLNLYKKIKSLFGTRKK